MKNKKLLLSIIIFSTILTTFSFYFYQVFFSPNFLINDSEKKIYIYDSTTFKDLQNTFYNKDVIKYINENYYAVKFNAESPKDVTFFNICWL